MTTNDIEMTALQSYWAIFNFLDGEPNLPANEASLIATEVQNLVQARLTEFFK